MSDPIDIKALDEYLKGGSDISRALRELGRDEVPPELDRRVLDEARAAVASGGGTRSRSWLRWSAPLALAASVVLVVTVVIESGVHEGSSYVTQPVAVDPSAMDEVRDEGRRQAEEYKLQEQAAAQLAKQEQEAQFAPEPPAAVAANATPASAPAAPPPAPLARAAAERSNAVAPEEVRVDAKALRDLSVASSPVAVDTSALDSPAAQVAAEQPSPTLAGSVSTISARKEVSREVTPAPAEADSSDDEVSSVAVTGTRARRAVRTAGPRNTISSSGSISGARPAADEEAAQIDPQKWLEEIRELRRAGKVSEADLAWQDFRKAYPQFPVADDDIARKK